jgi:hypothetical protein
MISLKKLTKRVALLSLSVIFLSGTVVVNTYEFNSSKIYALGETDLCITLIDGEENVMVVSYAKDGFSIDRLSDLTRKTDVSTIDKLVVLDSYEGVDVYSLLTAFGKVLDIKSVYYPEKDLLYDEVLKKSYVDVEVVSYSTETENTELFSGVSCSCFGKGLIVNSGKEKVLIFSDFGDYVNKYSGFSLFDMNVVIAYDCVKEIEKEYFPKQTISYLPFENYENCNANGYYAREIK